MKFDCPINDYSCSYYIAGICHMEYPTEECDAFFEMEDVEGDYEMGFDPYLGCYTDDC